jgi:hypothetical protein
MTRLEDLTAVTYRLPLPADPAEHTLERVGQSAGPDRWAVRRGRMCLASTGEWEWEPLPSGRDEAFFARCRFATAEAALAAWDSYLATRREG